MADFEDDLSGMFQTAVDQTVGRALAEAALARIARQDQRRRLALTLAGAVGVLTAGAIAGAAGAPEAAREFAVQMMALSNASMTSMKVVWPLVAVGVAVCAVQALRVTRTL